VPTYEYHCAHCDRTFDVVQSFQDDPLKDCPTCGQPVKKVFGNVGIVFKGSGFYKTDSRSPGRPKSTDGSDGSDGAAAPAAAPSESPSAGSSKDSSATSPAPGSASTGGEGSPTKRDAAPTQAPTPAT